MQKLTDYTMTVQYLTLEHVYKFRTFKKATNRKLEIATDLEGMGIHEYTIEIEEHTYRVG